MTQLWTENPLIIDRFHGELGRIEVSRRALSAAAVLEQFKDDLASTSPCFDLNLEPDLHRVTYVPLPHPYSNAAVHPTPVHDPWLGPCLDFDGKSQRANLVSPRMLLPTTATDEANKRAFLLTCWVRPDVASGPILGHGEPDRDGWVIGVDQGIQMAGTTAGPVNLIVGAWFHLAISYEGSNTLKVYVNGREIASQTKADYDWWATVGNGLALGHPTPDGGFYQGRMGPVTIYRGVQTDITTTLAHEIEAILPSFQTRPILDIVPAKLRTVGDTLYLVNNSPKAGNKALDPDHHPVVVQSDTVGRSLDFADAAQPVTWSHSDLADLTDDEGEMHDFTLEMWVKPNFASDGAWGDIFGVGSETQFTWALSVGKLIGFSFGDQNLQTRDIMADLSKKFIQAWLHLALSYKADGQILHLYQNNKKVEQTEAPLVWSQDQLFWLTAQKSHLLPLISYKCLSEKFCDDLFLLEKLVGLTTTFRIGSKGKISVSQVKAVAISADGRTIVSGDGESLAKVWTHNGTEWTNRPVLLVDKSLTGTNEGHSHSSEIRSVAISPDGKTIVTGSSDKSVKVWHHYGSAWTRQPVALIDEIRITSIATVSYGENTSIVAGGSTHVRVWTHDGNTWTKKPHSLVDDTLPYHGHATGGQVESVAIGPKGETVIAGTSDGFIKIWKREGGTWTKRPISLPLRWINSIAISLDGETIVAGIRDGFVKVWGRERNAWNTTPLSLIDETTKGVRIGHSHHGKVSAVAISTDGKTIVSGGNDKHTKVWTCNKNDVWTKKPILLIDKTLAGSSNGQSHTLPISNVALSSDGRTIITGSDDSIVKVWSVSRKSLFRGQLSHIRLYDRVLSQDEIQANMERDFRVGNVGSSHTPLEFSLLNAHGDGVLYLEDSGQQTLDQSLTLTLKNKGDEVIQLPSSRESALSLLELLFRPGTLRRPEDVKLSAASLLGSGQSEDTPNWALDHVAEPDGTDLLRLWRNTGGNGTGSAATLRPGETISLKLHGLNVDHQGGSRATRVQLRYFVHALDSGLPLTGSRQHYLSVVPMDATGLQNKVETLEQQSASLVKETEAKDLTIQQLRVDLNQLAQVVYQVAQTENMITHMLQPAPISAGVMGSATILNDGQSMNTLTLYLVNHTKDGVSLKGTPTFTFEIDRYTDTTPWGLLMPADSLPGVAAHGDTYTNGQWTYSHGQWTIGNLHSGSEHISLEVKPPSNGDDHKKGMLLAVALNFKSSAPAGSGYVKVHFENLADADKSHGHLIIPVQRTPVLIPDNTQNRTVVAGELGLVDAPRMTLRNGTYDETESEHLLFDLPFNDYKDELKDGTLTKKLKQAFESNDVHLTSAATLNMEVKDQQWRVDDGANRHPYIIRKQKDKQSLTISQNSPTSASIHLTDDNASLALESTNKITLNSIKGIELQAQVEAQQPFLNKLEVMAGKDEDAPQPTDKTGIYYNGHPGHLVPSGTIVMYHPRDGIACPTGWAVCDGKNGTPDLRNRFIVAAGDGNDSEYKPGPHNDGNDKVLLNKEQLPSHTHPIKTYTDWKSKHTHEIQIDWADHGGAGQWVDSTDRSHWFKKTFTSTEAGHHNHYIDSNTEGLSHTQTELDLRPAYYALVFIMKL
ncbi:hypothetical protein KFU94_44340 [Chloroflexi bacterium TSY]|nr:hypothetical protein [Chloroflexi bacterium TSY]